ncbi:D-alanyl-D-alanine carboxypeptidase family protein [Vibrio sp. CAIM 722]|uniref:D-alanyl-D-alanine carboxypeptidase family protein n=1 Tax=Vibrio eleionomae TaxID=2653505 RepID=A0A7X4LHL2_9VIBR|nr:M15 family metallopeptidase [Vibrio eleionomae]MZI92042.1 D-alanyl-D-alanine carboxypeptidase family protein [Vibrio eleionomae]
MTPKQLTGQTDTHLQPEQIGQKTFLVAPSVADDLHHLRQAALNDGFNFHIASGFRSFERQLSIWNRKMSGELAVLDENSHPIDIHSLSEEEQIQAILRWSALPGASRHHWGSDFDVFDKDALPDGVTLNLEPEEYLKGHQHSFYLWLKQHAAQYGFFFPFQGKNHGVAFEPWHISHRATATHYLQNFSLEMLTQQISLTPILGQQAILNQLPSIYNQYIVNISD